MVLRRGLRLTLNGMVVGLVGALALTRLMSGLLYGVRPADPITLGSVVLLLGGVALLACYIPGTPCYGHRSGDCSALRVSTLRHRRARFGGTAARWSGFAGVLHPGAPRHGHRSGDCSALRVSALRHRRARFGGTAARAGWRYWRATSRRAAPRPSIRRLPFAASEYASSSGCSVRWYCCSVGGAAGVLHPGTPRCGHRSGDCPALRLSTIVANATVYGAGPTW